MGPGGRYDDRNPTGAYRLETRILEHKVSVCLFVCVFVLAAEPVVSQPGLPDGVGMRVLQSDRLGPPNGAAVLKICLTHLMPV